MEYQASVIRPDLGVVFAEYMAGANTFIGSKVLPFFGTDDQQGAFKKITRESVTRQVNDTHVAGEEFATVTSAYDEETYNCRDRGFMELVPAEEIKKNAFDVPAAKTRVVAQRMLQAHENRVATACFNTSLWTGTDLYKDYSANPWATAATDIPAQVDFAVGKVFANTGMEPNALILSQGAYRAMLSNTKINSMFQGAVIVSEATKRENLASVFGLKYLLVGSGVNNGSKAAQTFTSSPIWSASYAMVARVAEDGTNPVEEGGLGCTFTWNQFNTDPAYVEQIDIPLRDAIGIRARMFTDVKIIDKYFGFLMKIA